ncbi:MAG TPA: AAA family ATPase [Candidatus Polarisedimenticolia bacterium]|nr:AAA family ATPase [Candidatus Polarisedimenticolia bacterium]
MRIRRLTIAGFGSLKGDFIFSSDRCNLVLEPNESGKSTLAAAILAGLYGLPRQRSSRERPIKPKERFRPWSGGPFGLTMEVETADRGLVIQRDFQKEAALVLDARTGKEITREFSRGKDLVEVGEALTGVSREDFARCCFVGQRDIEGLREAEGLTHALQRIASSQQGDTAAGEALAALARAVDEEYRGMVLGKGKVDTEIRRLQQEIDPVRAEMEEIAGRRRQSEEKIRRLEQATAAERRAEAALARADALHLLAARAEAEAARQQCLRDDREMADYQREQDDLAPFSSFPSSRLGRLRELKGTIGSLKARHAEAQRRLREEIEVPLEEARRRAAELPGLGELGSDAAADAAGRVAVLADLWRQRRGKRAAGRREERRLRGEGIEPGRVSQLAALMSRLRPEDHAFVAAYRERALELKAALAETERRRDNLTRSETGSPLLVPLPARRGERAAVLLLFGGAILSLLVPFALDSKLPLLITLFMTFAGLIWWLMQQEKRPIPGAEQFGTELQRIQTEVWGLEKDLAGLHDTLARLALPLGYAAPEQLVEQHRELERLQQQSAALAALASGLQEIQQRYVAASQEVVKLMDRAGCPQGSRPITPRAAARFRDRLSAALEARARATALEAEREAALRDVALAGLEIERARSEARTILEEAFGAGAPLDDLEAAIVRFEDGAARRERHERLTKEILPAIERRHAIPPGVRAEELRVDAEVLDRQIARAAAQDPSLGSLVPDRPSRDYAEQKRRLQEEIRTAQTERLTLSDELGDVLKEYRRDYPGRQTLLQELETALARAVSFREAVALASDVLARLSREAYAEWADVLNEKTSDLLRRINPAYGDVRFDTDLSFTLRHAATAQRLDQAAVDAHLSTGARDQIYLAVRMAVSDYLSSAESRLPFILDDPFSCFDDARFARAMEFLLDSIGRRHQVILLSCHEARHRLWLSTAPAETAGRVRVVDLAPLSAA